jgi:phage tail sheath protein FI
MLVSPGIEVKEKDFSTIVPTVATSVGAIVGRFTDGPINVPVMISSEDELSAKFGKPTSTNYTEWFTASQFLQYSSSMWTVRAAPAGVANATSTGSGVTVLNTNEYYDADKFTSQERSTAGTWVAKDPGTKGNNIAIMLIDSDTWDEFGTWCTSNLATLPNGQSYVNYFNNQPGTSTYISSKSVTSTENKKDELHILVIDVDGHITGTRMTVLEKFEGTSKALDAIDYTGKSIYYVNVINNESQYVWWSAHTASVTSGANIIAWGSQSIDVAPDGKSFAAITVALAPNFLYQTMSGGVAGTTPNAASLQSAYDTLKNKDLYNANMFMTAAFDSATVKHVVENVVYERKDAMAFISPNVTGKPVYDTDNDPASEITTFLTNLAIAEQYSQYSVCDTGWKYIYDRYAGVYRWIPLNGDIAGICARVDVLADPWWSPGGFARGGVKNVLKLAYNPDQADRDILYPKGVNPVVAFPGQGVVLFGDRTMTLKPSAFDRINVRRLFIILEKAISIAAKYQLFEFNDEFTRAQFKNMVEPFLRNIQGRRGITGFAVRCDSTNNPGDVIDRNEFVAEIFVKPSKSINFITLSFVATRTDVQFSTLFGA